MKRLGIIDWGIGGISIYKLVSQKFGLGCTYFSDTGATPYGKMKQAELTERVDRVIEFLKDGGVTHLVIGCNAASTAIPFLKDHGIVIEGMIDNAVTAAIKQKPASLAVIGGRRTILSGVYRRGFADHGVAVKQRIAQPLSGLIESGDVSSDQLRGEAAKILRPIKNCSHILLACTHYPAIETVLSEFVSAKTRFIDPAATIVDKISKWKLDAGGEEQFFTSGDPSAMIRSAKLAFGVEIPSVSKVSARDLSS